MEHRPRANRELRFLDVCAKTQIVGRNEFIWYRSARGEEERRGAQPER
jgi:hypothetical protein